MRCRWEWRGIFCQFGSLEVIDCVIARNLSFDTGGWGGAILAEASTLVVRGCTIFENACAWSGQIDLFISSVATLENTIIAFGLPGNVGCWNGSTATIVCSDVFDYPWGNCIASQQNQNGNMSLDPLFCDAEGLDLRLHPESPCLPEGSMGCGLIGVLGEGCGAVSVEPQLNASSWGALKALFR